MRQEIKDIIINQSLTIEQKRHLLHEFEESIELANKYLEEYRYCPSCKDFYLKKSYIIDTEYNVENVCTYSDPINSGGDEYERRKVKYTNRLCPKGHIVERIGREDLGKA